MRIRRSARNLVAARFSFYCCCYYFLTVDAVLDAVAVAVAAVAVAFAAMLLPLLL